MLVGITRSAYHLSLFSTPCILVSVSRSCFLIGIASLLWDGSAVAQESKTGTPEAIILGDELPEAEQVLAHLGYQVRPRPESPQQEIEGDTEQQLKELRLHLQRVEAAFHSGRIGEGENSLHQSELVLEKLWDRGFEESVTVKLWRAGFAQSTEEDATAWIDVALAIDPDMSVDLNRFWPSLADAVEARRNEGDTVVLRLANLSPGAEIFVDRRASPQELRLRKGRHRILVRAPGYRTEAREIALEDAQVIDWRLQRLHAEFADNLPSRVAAKRCSELGTAVCVFAGRYGIVLLRLAGDGGATEYRYRGTTGVASWIEDQLRAEPSIVSISPWEWNAGLILGGLQAISVSWGESELAMQTESSGLRAGALWRSNPDSAGLFAGGSLSVQRTFEGNLTATNIQSEVPKRVPSSWHMQSRALVGYESRFLSRFGVSPYVSTELFSTRFRDPRDDEGHLRVFGPVTFVSIALGLQVDVDLTESVRLGVDGTFSAIGFTLESPDSLGGEGDPGLGRYGVNLGWKFSETARVVFGFSIRQTPLRLSGPGTTRVQPQVQDADIDLVSAEGTLKVFWRSP